MDLSTRLWIEPDSGFVQEHEVGATHEPDSDIETATLPARQPSDRRPRMISEPNCVQQVSDRRVGTDHLLLGLLHDPGIVVALGTDAERARAAAQDLDHAR